MTKAAAKTGVSPMVMVAIEQHFPEEQRILVDPLAHQILPFSMRAFGALMRPAFARNWMVRSTEKSVPGIWGGMLCRKRYIDEKLSESIGRIETVVNLGAGFDTRAYRLGALVRTRVPVWEVDQPENVAAKRARLRKLFKEVPAHVTLVSIDFDRKDLAAVMAAHGYSLEKRTFFIWEAVSQYLTEEGIRTTFAFFSRAAPGSILAFTYAREDFLEGKEMYGQEALYEKFVERENIWLFGMEPEGVAPFLQAYGWRVVEHLGYEELAERYVRPTGRALTSTPIERMVLAEKQ
jgi:methyltransferase (TIGR00027 family)